MAAVNLIGEGQSFLGENPQIVKVKKISIGVAASNDVVFDAIESLPVLNVPAGTLVLNVAIYTPTAWTATCILDVGDGTDPDGFLATAKVAPTVAQTNGVRKLSTLPTAEAYAGGKFYAVDDTIDVAVGTAIPVVGQSDIYVTYIEDHTRL